MHGATYMGFFRLQEQNGKKTNNRKKKSGYVLRPLWHLTKKLLSEQILMSTSITLSRHNPKVCMVILFKKKKSTKKE